MQTIVMVKLKREVLNVACAFNQKTVSVKENGKQCWKQHCLKRALIAAVKAKSSTMKEGFIYLNDPGSGQEVFSDIWYNLLLIISNPIS